MIAVQRLASPGLRRLVLASVAASLLGGIPAGILARVAMAILGGAGGSSMMAIVGQLTLPGTVRILIVPMLFGIPLAAVLLALGGRWARAPLAVRAFAYALASLVLGGLPFFTDSEFQAGSVNSQLGPWLFVPAFVVYGAFVGLIGDRLLGRSKA